MVPQEVPNFATTRTTRPNQNAVLKAPEVYHKRFSIFSYGLTIPGDPHEWQRYDGIIWVLRFSVLKWCPRSDSNGLLAGFNGSC